MTSSDTRRFALFGVGLEITTGCRELWSAVKARLPPLEPGFRGRAADRRYTLEPGAGPDSPLALRRGSRKPVRVPDADRAADLLVDDLERFVAHRAPGLVFVHAGAVVWKGRAILLPGRSGTGKSELVAALLRAGARYLSDEFGIIDAAGRVLPYARRLGLRRGGGSIERVTPQSLGARVASSPYPLAMTVLLRYREGSRWRLKRISRGEALLALLANTLAARKRFELARAALVSLTASAAAFRGTRGPADEAARELLSRVELFRDLPLGR